MTDELTKLRTALAEAQTRERIAVQELQKMRQRAETAEKTLEPYKRANNEHPNNTPDAPHRTGK